MCQAGYDGNYQPGLTTNDRVPTATDDAFTDSERRPARERRINLTPEVPGDGDAINLKIRQQVAKGLVGCEVEVIELGSFKPDGRPVRLLPLPEYGITLVKYGG